MKHDDLNGLRKQLLLNGYKIIPNKYKEPAAKGWNRPDFIVREMTPERVESWSVRFVAPTTGLLICDGLCVVDIDVDNPLAEDLLFEIERIAPQLAAAPMRFGGGQHKVALFCRTEDVFVREASRKYNGHAVEIFGGARLKSGNISRQFGIYGPHSEGINYAWAAEVPDLTAIRAENLPLLSREQALAICGEFERLAEAAGWKAEEKPKTETSSVVYDIDTASRFDTNRAGRGLTYAELSAAAESYGEFRCSSSFIKGREGTDPSRCWVFWSSRHDCAAVFVFGDEATHYPVEFAPKPDLIKEALKSIQRFGVAQSKKPDNDAELSVKAQWLIENYGYCALSDSIIELFKPRQECQLKPLAFNRLYRGWRVEEVGPKGGKKYIYATAYWEVDEKRVDIEGIRMRPDMPFPIYEENGRKFKNTYQKPQHTLGGDLEPFLAFMERFIPDKVEREWLFDWMAHKQARPDIPGTAIMFVADDEDSINEGTYGTGRGFFFRTVHRLYGEQYARAQTFSVMDGSSGQAQFTAWMHGSVLVTVDESRTSATAYRRGERSATYEILKDIVDPAPKRHEFKVKGGQAIDGMSYCSFMVATNHGDALAIPEGDRRFTILSNGRPMLPIERSTIAAWLDQPDSIGALSGFLTSRNLDYFDMYQPLETGGKSRMVDKARTDVENIMRGFMVDPDFPLAFTKQYMARAVENNLDVKGAFWQGEFSKAWKMFCAKILTSMGNPRRPKIDERQTEVFCFRGRKQKLELLPDSLFLKKVNSKPLEDDKPALQIVVPLRTKT